MNMRHAGQPSLGDDTLKILRLIQLVQADCVANMKFFDNQRHPIQFCVSMLNNVFKPMEGSKAIWGAAIQPSDLGFLASNQNSNQNNPVRARGGFRRRDEAMADDDSEEEDDEESESSSDDMDGEDVDLLDSDREQRHQHFHFSQHNGADDDEEEHMDDGYSDEDMSGNEDPEGVLAVRRLRPHHHHDDDDDEEEEGEDDIPSHSESYGNEGEEAMGQMLLQAFNQQPGVLGLG